PTQPSSLSLHDALPISQPSEGGDQRSFNSGVIRGVRTARICHYTSSSEDERALAWRIAGWRRTARNQPLHRAGYQGPAWVEPYLDRKSTRLNSSHRTIS